MKEKTAIILISSQALPMAQLLQKELGDCTIFFAKNTRRMYAGGIIR